jgi:hypothetical protein
MTTQLNSFPCYEITSGNNRNLRSCQPGCDITSQPRNHGTHQHDTHAKGATHMLCNIIQLQNDCSFSVHISALSSCIRWLLFQECSSMPDFDFFSRCCVVPVIADSHLNQVSCSFRIHMACCTCSFCISARPCLIWPLWSECWSYVNYLWYSRTLLLLYG